jgi:hypothetical protein
VFLTFLKLYLPQNPVNVSTVKIPVIPKFPGILALDVPKKPFFSKPNRL